MEIQQLRHLIAAVQHGNLLKAAEESHISQSGLSRSIKSLENRLGVPLLIRKSKGVEPTIFGLSLIRRAHVIISEAAHSIREIHAIGQAQIGEVALGITANYTHYLVPRMVAELTSERPALRVTVVTDSCLNLIERLKAGVIDVAFGCVGAVGQTAGMIVEELMESQSRVFVARNHRLLHADVRIDDLARARWAMLSGEVLQRNFLDYFQIRGKSIPIQAIKTDSIALLKRVVMTGDLLTILPVEAVADEVGKGTLCILPCETPAEFARVGFLFRADNLTTPPMKLVVERIRDAVARDTRYTQPSPAR